MKNISKSYTVTAHSLHWQQQMMFLATSLLWLGYSFRQWKSDLTKILFVLLYSFAYCLPAYLIIVKHLLNI